MSIYRRVLLYYRPFFAPTALALGISLVTVGLNLLKPWPFKVIVDEVLSRPAAWPDLPPGARVIWCWCGARSSWP